MWKILCDITSYVLTTPSQMSKTLGSTSVRYRPDAYIKSTSIQAALLSRIWRHWWGWQWSFNSLASSHYIKQRRVTVDWIHWDEFKRSFNNNTNVSFIICRCHLQHDGYFAQIPLKAGFFLNKIRPLKLRKANAHTASEIASTHWDLFKMVDILQTKTFEVLLKLQCMFVHKVLMKWVGRSSSNRLMHKATIF